jgi:MerR family transcriptional regulator, redox-sensitive transcriptional activator SoxR
MAIGEVAQRAGLVPSTIRYWESVGILPAPERVNGQRRYDERVFQRLAIIRVAQEAGFNVTEIRTLLRGFSREVPPSARWRALASAKLEDIDAAIARAEAMKRILQEGLECDCLRLEDCALLANVELPADSGQAGTAGQDRYASSCFRASASTSARLRGP